MRPSLSKMATASMTGASPGLRRSPAALLPPIPLYRRILRAHRRLPAEMRLLGDSYIKDEYRKHRTIENPLHIIGFLTEWQLYAQKIEGDLWKGDKLDKQKIDKMSDQQLGQLYELMQEIQKQGQHGTGEDTSN